MRTPHANNIQ